MREPRSASGVENSLAPPPLDNAAARPLAMWFMLYDSPYMDNYNDRASCDGIGIGQLMFLLIISGNYNC